ncbi:MAG: sulfatase [Prolixibacteraceae bacterium]
MKHKTLYQILFSLSLLFFLSSSTPEKKNRQLNVLFIGIDDLRTELGCYGEDHIVSPNIDKLAMQGMLFNRAYVQQAVCAASRASLLTGCYPNTTGVDYPYSRYFIDEFLPKHPSIPRYFYEKGFFTVAMGKLHHGPNFDLNGLSLPYPDRNRHWKASYALPENNKLAMTGDGSNKPPVEMAEVHDTVYDDGFLAEEAIKSLQICSKQEKPFFLAVGFKKPHLPFACPKKYWDLYDRNEIDLAPVPTLPKNAPQFAIANYELSSGYAGDYGAKNTMVPDSVAKLLRHGYFACVSFVDAQVGKVLDELDRLGLRENTVIVLWSDHGFQLGDQQNWTKHTNFELATRSPLIISYPDMKNSGERTNALVEYVDIFPTLCDLTGTPAPDYLEGISLKKLLKNPDRSWKSAAFSQYPRGKNREGFAIRTSRYRYVEWKRKDGEIVARELYDHKIDPQESHNVAEKHPDVVAELSQKLAAGWRTTLPEGIGNNSDNPVAPTPE